jgi:hypothetical protein
MKTLHLYPSNEYYLHKYEGSLLIWRNQIAKLRNKKYDRVTWGSMDVSTPRLFDGSSQDILNVVDKLGGTTHYRHDGDYFIEIPFSVLRSQRKVEHLRFSVYQDDSGRWVVTSTSQVSFDTKEDAASYLKDKNV